MTGAKHLVCLVDRERAETIAAFHRPPSMLGILFLIFQDSLPFRGVGRADRSEVVGDRRHIPPWLLGREVRGDSLGCSLDVGGRDPGLGQLGRFIVDHAVSPADAGDGFRCELGIKHLHLLTAVENGNAGTVSRRSKMAAHNRAVLGGVDRGYSPDPHLLSERGTGVHSDMEIWSEIRLEVLTGVLSKRAAIAKYGIGWRTLKKMLAHDEPPGYRQANQRPKPKLEPFLPVIRQILEDDGRAPTKQKHTARRIFERLRDEYGYTGGETVVKDAVREYRISHRDVFLPLSHPPGEAQVDFGEATVRIRRAPCRSPQSSPSSCWKPPKRPGSCQPS